jgi:hypothetical protein
LHSNILPGTDDPTGYDDCHHPAFANHLTVFGASENFPEQSRLEPVDLLAGVPKSGDADNRFVTKVKQCAGGKRQQVNATRRHVLAHLTSRNPVARCRDFIEELGMDQVHLSEVGLGGIARDSGEMLDGHARMGVTLNTPASDQPDLVDDGLTEPVVRIPAHSDDGSCQVVQRHETILTHGSCQASTSKLATAWLSRDRLN